MKPCHLTPDQSTAALLLYLFACLHFDGRRAGEIGRGDDGWWYEWVVEQRSRARTPFERAVWWALRFEADDPENDWLGYVAYCYENERR